MAASVHRRAAPTALANTLFGVHVSPLRARRARGGAAPARMSKRWVAGATVGETSSGDGELGGPVRAADYGSILGVPLPAPLVTGALAAAAVFALLVLVRRVRRRPAVDKHGLPHAPVRLALREQAQRRRASKLGPGRPRPNQIAGLQLEHMPRRARAYGQLDEEAADGPAHPLPAVAEHISSTSNGRAQPSPPGSGQTGAVRFGQGGWM